jgi:hypothetical protein
VTKDAKRASPAFSKQSRKDAAVQFDPSVRDQKGADNGAWFGEELPAEAAVSSSQGFRSGTGEEQSQGLEEEPASASAMSLSELSSPMKLSDFDRRKEEISQRIRADFDRSTLDQLTTVPELARFAEMLRRDYGGEYEPRADSSVKSIKTGLIKAYKL